MMKILYINTYFWGGGAEKVARQLYYGLNTEDIKTYFMAGRYQKGLPDNISVIYRNFFERAISYGMGMLSHNFLFGTVLARKKIISFIKKEKIDIVHFHNIHGNYIGPADLKEIKKYCSNIILTMHDMWLFTGCCPYGMECNKWENSMQCRKCRGNKQLRRGTIRAKIYLKCKKKNLGKKGVYFVCPSKWLMECCNQSYLKTENIRWIPNGININHFQVFDKKEIRKKYGLPLDKHILMFSAHELNSPYKGFEYLYDALLQLSEKKRYCLLVVGKGEIDKSKLQFDVCNIGYIKEEKIMSELYAAADLFIIPSIADTFPFMMLESMASGTPVLAFKTGGIPEAVNSRVGWCVEPGDSTALKDMITYIFSNEKEYAQKAQQCRTYIEENFTENIMLERYRELYQNIINGK